MDYLPIFLNIKGNQALIVGGGDVAARKVSLLRRAGARVKIVAPTLDSTLAQLAAAGDLIYQAKLFEPADLDGSVIVIAATDDLGVNQAVAIAAQARALPVNVVDQPALCSFIMPSIIERGLITAAISTGGASPVLARLIRFRMELALPPGIDRLVSLASQWRDQVKQALPDGVVRRRFWEVFLTSSWARRTMKGEQPEFASVLQEIRIPAGEMTLIPVNATDPDTLTMREMKQICTADLILYEAGIPDSILEHVRRDAELRLLVGTEDPNGLFDRELTIVKLIVKNEEKSRTVPQDISSLGPVRGE